MECSIFRIDFFFFTIIVRILNEIRLSGAASLSIFVLQTSLPVESAVWPPCVPYGDAPCGQHTFTFLSSIAPYGWLALLALPESTDTLEL